MNCVRHHTLFLASLATLVWLSCAIACPSLVSASGSERFGGEHKGFSYSVVSGMGVFSGTRSQFATKSFDGEIESDLLLSDPSSISFEYSEHIGKSSLATGISYTSVQVSDELKSALGLSTADKLSVSYLDFPMTYRLHAFAPGESQWNVSAGVSLIMMLDIAKSSVALFETTGDDGGSESPESSDKHIDFGFGFGGGFGLERRISSGLYLRADAGFHRSLTGVTRPAGGYARAGLRWYQF